MWVKWSMALTSALQTVKGEIFKLSNGKYVAPQVIEGKLNESPYIENSLVIGSNQKVALAITFPNA